MRAFILVFALISCNGLHEEMMQTVDDALAVDRAYHHHASAKPMERAVEWMEKQGTDEERQKTYYVMGRVYDDLGQEGEALRAYQQASESGDPRGEFSLLALSHIGQIYLDKGQATEALSWFRRTLDMATPARDTVAMVSALRDMARALQGDEEMAGAAANCLQRAEELMKQAGRDDLAADFYPDLLAHAMERKDAAGVRSLLHTLVRQGESLSGMTVGDSGPLSLTMGRAYLFLEREDSARLFLRRAMASDHADTHAAAAMLLSQLDVRQGHPQEAWMNAMECVAMMDSVHKIDLQKERSLVAQLSDRLAVERENNRLRWRMGLLLMAVSVVIIVMGLVIRRHVLRLREQAERYKLACELMRRRSEVSLSRQEQLLKAFRQSDLYTRIVPIADGLANGTLSEELWAELESFIDDETDDFCIRLLSSFPKMKKNDLRLCMLLKLEFSNVQVSNLFHRTQQATTNARKRLYARMFGHDGSADELNRYLQTL